MDEILPKLESSLSADQEYAKRELVECFASTKESWIVNGLIDYFAQTNSQRVLDVLIKVQTPHDINIFNKLQKCLQERQEIRASGQSNRSQKAIALCLFNHIVRKHPTWLHKVVNHGFLKDLLKLLKHERDIVTFISGILCIISLLPIIPASISAYLSDLFDIFNHMATWTLNPVDLSSAQLVHLQYVLYTLFNRLYGMYPNNFMDFLRNEYIMKQERTQIFNFTIRPLLETVLIHPLLVTSTKTSETNSTRFKKMEPHDVVVECLKYVVENGDTELSSSSGASRFIDYPICTSPMKPLEYTHLVFDLPALPKSAAALISAKTVENKFESLWSPSLVVLATPPPITSNTIPNTPNPTPVNNYSIPMSNTTNQSIEAAVEATPETTPMKPIDMKGTCRPYPINSQTARNIWPKNSTSNTSSVAIVGQQSSPLKKDPLAINQLQPSHQQLQYNLDLTGNQKLMRLFSDRQMHSSELHPLTVISLEDQEVNDINSQTEIKIEPLTVMDYEDGPSETEEEQDADDEDADTTPPLYNTGIYQNFDYVRRVKRLRMYSHCIYSAGTSPADTTSYMPRAGSSNRLKRYNSWPNLRSNDVIIDSRTNSKNENHENGQKQPSSSPSDEAISAVSHFKNSDQNGNSNIVKAEANESIFKKIRKDLKSKALQVQKVSSSAQTIEEWPSNYDAMFYSLFSDELKRKQAQNEPVATTVRQTTTVTTTSIQQTHPSTQQPMTANEMLDQYIQLSLKRKSSNDYRDEIELLAIQLQFERHRREIHAERNRRLLGKSRQIRGLEQNNATLTDQVARLSAEIKLLHDKAAEMRHLHQTQMQKANDEIKFWSKKFNDEVERTKQLQRERELLQLHLEEEKQLKRQLKLANDECSAEIFDLKNLLENAMQDAQRGRQYRDQLVKLESEMIIFNEARIKCQQKMDELEALKARDAEMDFLTHAYAEELREVKRILDMKSSQVDNYRARIADLEQQIQKRDIAFTEQKRLIKTIKDEHVERFRVLEEKYAVQKAIIIKMEEHILEMTRNQAAITSPESERTADLGGCTSPLSLSLASSEGLSASLRSTTELRMQPLVVGGPVSSSSTSGFDQQLFMGGTNSQQPGIQRQASIDDDGPSGVASAHPFRKK